MVDSYKTEILSGERFEFGANWSRFLGVMNLYSLKSPLSVGLLFNDLGILR